jgi:hypothetical protein
MRIEFSALRSCIKLKQNVLSSLTGFSLFLPAGKKRRVGKPSACKSAFQASESPPYDLSGTRGQHKLCLWYEQDWHNQTFQSSKLVLGLLTNIDGGKVRVVARSVDFKQKNMKTKSCIWPMKCNTATSRHTASWSTVRMIFLHIPWISASDLRSLCCARFNLWVKTFQQGLQVCREIHSGLCCVLQWGIKDFLCSQLAWNLVLIFCITFPSSLYTGSNARQWPHQGAYTCQMTFIPPWT